MSSTKNRQTKIKSSRQASHTCVDAMRLRLGDLLTFSVDADCFIKGWFAGLL